MKTTPETPMTTPDFSGLSTAGMTAVVEELQQKLAAKEIELQQRDKALE
jgi:adenylylsulfate kinase-like enzyme